MNKFFLIIIVTILSIGSTYATGNMTVSQVDALWNKANNNYADKDYESALAGYLELEKKAGVSSKLYLNIGNAYFKMGQLAKSILYYNRAELLSPSNADIKHNLEVANAHTTNKIEAIPTFFVVEWVNALRNIMSANKWGVFSLITLGLTLVMGLVFWFSRAAIVRKSTFTIGCVSIALFFVSLIFGSMQRNAISNSNYAIVMQNSVPVKSSPDASGKDIFVLNEGVRVNVGERIGAWAKVTVASGQNGWIDSQNIETI